ncbi:MAG: glutamate N-acetyltransferase / amino-acid N-acetyltransferase [Pseudonocardiales bacterium]|nr:glutamate N-acetyltransferase / amino-acid N-acetyltransferase [Pseudonocardiales bacterium]MDT7563274.1 glutamate N-acetyltransferase / amino-acid N-acetyltransferase [Pseudonocardiales bacterium]MDT7624313.1 glutamate N-acetyltransferase / amino-acid N-acetyltransferase [Pseudonocardiales bacterium]MDT7673118.1 glutamate N-acetyltransferase / amino-acid N-acetyltransferase [Pseudonocardiales bacterium]
MTVTAPSGFRAAGIAAGIKTTGALDMAMVVNDGPQLHAAGVFTTNKIQAAPVLWSRQVLTTGRLRAVVLNSGGANACTGSQGFQTTHATAEKAAEVLECGAAEIAVCSTGLIGSQLPRDVVLAGVAAVAAKLADTGQSATEAATAVLTTDTRPKQGVYRDDDGWRIGGFAKGAGMVAPAMATLLAVLSTDASVEPAELDRALRAASSRTFEQLDFDGGTSTNDTVLLMANGASGVKVGAEELTDALTAFCTTLVDQLQADAEGATKHVTVAVRGAATEREALAVARRVARDSLVKTAFFGSDPNWGRVAMAVGNANATIDPHRLEIAMNGVTLCRDGAVAADRRAADLSGRDILVEVDLHVGAAAAQIRTTDLSPRYVEENSAYPS